MEYWRAQFLHGATKFKASILLPFRGSGVSAPAFLFFKPKVNDYRVYYPSHPPSLSGAPGQGCVRVFALLSTASRRLKRGGVAKEGRETRNTADP